MTRNMDESSFSDMAAPPTFLLKQLDVYNWGPFGGRYSAEIDPHGTAIIGPTGSGKTTLIDAFMTLVTANPKYNLASTGGHESDRDLISYIRGVSGAGNNSGDNSHVARTGKTSTAISVVFGHGKQSVRIGALFWIDGTSSSHSDLKRLWLFAERNDQTMQDWLSIHHDGGARALKQLGRETVGLQVFDSKKGYLAQLRRFFEVGENAFALLNRAAGLKQLNSIDEIFRELVLDDRSVFHRAAEVADEFNALADIRGELETARNQQRSILPIERMNRDYQTCYDTLSEQRSLVQLLPTWFALAGTRLWGLHMEALLEKTEQLAGQIEAQKLQAGDLQARVETQRALYLKAGGAGVEPLEGQINTQLHMIAMLNGHVDDYLALTRALGLDGTLSSKALEKNKLLALEKKEALESQYSNLEKQAFEYGARLSRHEKLVAEKSEELKKIKARPGSNIPGREQDFRADLAKALNLNEKLLPFVAELVEVKRTESRWRGAIERAIGAHRLRILVPPRVMQPALNWVNNRDNRIHVRLQEAKSPEGTVKFHKDSFCHKLKVKKHPHLDPLMSLLSGIDRHCVESPEELRDTLFGMTDQGLMSGKKGQFDKQDQRSITEGWVTGFSNKDLLAGLSEELKQAETSRSESERLFMAAKNQVTEIGDTLRLVSKVAGQNYDDIDLPGAEKTLEILEKQLADLTDPESAAGKAHQKYHRLTEELREISSRVRNKENDRARLEEQCRAAGNKRDEANDRIGEGLTDEQQALAENFFTPVEEKDRDRLDPMERTERNHLDKVCIDLDGKFRKFQQDLVRFMEGAKKADTGALVETGTELQDIPTYLERLRVLNEEALPDKLKRFLVYLNQSSDQGVTQLLTDVQNEVAIIEERIEDLNNTLKRVDFQAGHYLQLVPRRVVHKSLGTLETARRHLRSAALKDDEGESHYRALEKVVQLLRDAAENKRTVGARALLDPRYRLQFAVSVLERETERVIETRTGSQGGSGGEKEIMASYILTASLSYALCPYGATHPLFSTIILDEAFSRSSQAVAGRIISALREFGLHPLFVTPNKEMRLLRTHTRSAILVHRKAMQATLTSMSWEELEAQAEKRTRRHDEVTG